ncbi:nuclear transport factor 2 family protein [Jannaschia sp. Os4]|uniref:nuclear transport factor 2 family protein n=1 Tax=Jannaschia sp. Os4 TaxID=2807617 RepID=UPI0019397E75|nr:nuclear transport factor 2 family protein [Jannaschia sp. Os4]MBM2575930.1 nuclear transport factor 2 family protein [Jannaschia sp. Os4]
MRSILLAALPLLAPAAAAADAASIAAVRAAEARFYAAFLARDGAAMRSVFADDFVYQHGSGVEFGPDAFADLIEAEAAVVTRADTPALAFRDYGDVVVTYGQGPVAGLLGADPFEGDLRFVNIWTREGDAWRLAHRNSELLPPE